MRLRLPASAQEVINVITLAAWGVAVATRPPAFRAGAIYDVLESLAPPHWWAGVSLMLAGALVIGWWLRDYRARYLSLWLALMWWIWLTCTVFLAAGLAAGAVVYLSVTCSFAWSFRDVVEQRYR